MSLSRLIRPIPSLPPLLTLPPLSFPLPPFDFPPTLSFSPPSFSVSLPLPSSPLPSSPLPSLSLFFPLLLSSTPPLSHPHIHQQDTTLLASKKTELEEKGRECESLQERGREAEEAVQRSRQHYQAVTAGLSSGVDGQDETLAAQKIGGSPHIKTQLTHLQLG